MSINKAYKAIDTESEELNKIQDYVSAAIGDLANNRLINGIILKNIKLVSGLNEIEHKLNRQLIGWKIIRIRTNAQVWDEQDANKRSAKTLLLQASAPVTIDLYVF